MSIPLQRFGQAIELALKVGQAAEAEALCRYVLAHHRWHLRSHLLLAQACLERELWEEAERRLRLVVAVDPENAEAHSGLGVVALARDDLEAATRCLAHAFENAPDSDEVRDALRQSLSRRAGRPVPPPAFTPACVGRFYLQRGLPQPAAEAFAVALRDDPDRPDLKLAYAVALWQAGVHDQAASICQPFLDQTPHPLVALLVVAAHDFYRGRVQSGRQLWGEARAWDPEELRARTLFGNDPRLPVPPRPVLLDPPEDRELRHWLEMAEQVATATGGPAGAAAQELASYVQGLAARGEPPAPQPSDPDLRRFAHAVTEVRARLFGDPPPETPPPPRHSGEPQPVEVLLAWEAGLRQRFGAAALARIDEALRSLARAVEQQGIAARVVYLDRPPYPEMARPDPQRPEEIKEFLDALDRRLAEEHLDFHYLLLVGGDELLPFARLPNPTDDSDETVPSDNLYASRDPTYLIPERAIGRLPDGGRPSPDLLLQLLEQSVARLSGVGVGVTRSGCLTAWMPWSQPKANPTRRFGLSAQVWARASEELFHRLPGEEPLHLCPPTCREAILPGWLADISFAYFNLHGAATSPNWYGQRDVTLPGEGPLMPVAFSPQEVPAGRVGGVIVYSEACYGAHILGKDPQSSIALRFLSEGALGVVGSTVISYGVAVPPLGAADLLGAFFWQHALAGKPLGEALLQAKLDFTREMYRQQGYLDGDDMKTLLEFVLYGDPLATVATPVPLAVAHISARESVSTPPPVLCAKHAVPLAPHQLSEELVARVRRSLAWLQQGEAVGEMNVALRSGCPGGHCAGACRPRNTGSREIEALVFTTRRELRTEDGTLLPQVARVVVDPGGRIVKMAVTR
jgi:tetratricopeptide (TPR) repeat protein